MGYYSEGQIRKEQGPLARIVLLGHPQPQEPAQHTPYHFHKLGLASGGCGVQMSQDIDMGFLGEADQGHIPSSFGHGVASCSYEPAKET